MLLRYGFLNRPWFIWFILCRLLKTGSALEIENGLIGSPEIKCNPDTIELAFRTKRVFRGKVFVKGHYSNPDCRVDYGKTTSNSSRNPAGGIKLTHGQCDMDRQRTIQPEGMQFSTILVISFHPLFITKLDRAFHIKCMYREAVRVVSSGIEVSAMATQALEYEYPMPNCIYTIRRDEIDGQILKYARVGDQIVHRWECQSDVYGLLVHTCFVEDGQGEKQMIIDQNGCHTDRTLLGDPTYVESLNMAYRESLVFKFADRVIVRFQCKIRLCIKENGGCASVTPPMCVDEEKQQTNGRFTTTTEPTIHYAVDPSNITDVQLKKRRLRSPVSGVSKPSVDADLISQPVYVLDAEDDSANGAHSARLRGNGGEREVCVSNAVFVALMCIMVTALLAVTASAVWFVLRWLRSSGNIVDEYYKNRCASQIYPQSF